MLATEPRRQKVCSACREQGYASPLIPGARNDHPEPVWFAFLVLARASWHTPDADARPLAALRVERGIFVSAPATQPHLMPVPTSLIEPSIDPGAVSVAARFT